MEKGDFVIYFATGRPRVGKYVNQRFSQRLIIIPKIGKRVIRSRTQVLSLNDLFKKYATLLKGEQK